MHQSVVSSEATKQSPWRHASTPARSFCKAREKQGARASWPAKRYCTYSQYTVVASPIYLHPVTCQNLANQYCTVQKLFIYSSSAGLSLLRTLQTSTPPLEQREPHWECNLERSRTILLLNKSCALYQPIRCTGVSLCALPRRPSARSSRTVVACEI